MRANGIFTYKRANFGADPLTTSSEKDPTHMNLRQAVHDFISNLELTDNQREAASNQHTYLREQLMAELTLDPKFNTFLTGSYSRSTAIRPLKDIDVFCVLKRSDNVNPTKWTPANALAYIKSALENIYSGKVAETQRRSVNIEFSGTGIAYDVVPAFVDEDAKLLEEEVFFIPDVDLSRWIRSNPRVHMKKSVEANDKAGTQLKPLTKAIKHWNRRQSKTEQLRSFHIEVMAWDVLTTKPDNRLQGLKTLFSGLASRVLYTTPDPAGLGPAIDEGMTWAEREAAKKRFDQAAVTMAEAIQLAADGKTEAAHHKLYTLFGDPYPEKGKAEPAPSPKAAATAAAVLPFAPDANGSRFG
jgi:Second Messenger Oligonucleotide or Dinucleotide Synthetase domain